MHHFSGEYQAAGFKLTFVAVRHDGTDKWGIDLKSTRGRTWTRETLGASPWPVLGEMIDAALDLERKNIARPARQQQETDHERQHQGTRRKALRQPHEGAAR